MAKETIESLVEGGNASPGPPLGPALGPTGLNIGKVIAAINEKTADYKGMKVPIKVVIDTDTKSFEVVVGSPPAASLLKKEAGIETGTKDGKPIANIEFAQLVKVAKMKKDAMLAKDLKAAVKEAAGTCVNVGLTIDNLKPKEMIAAINAGKYDAQLN
jgi:large subunit ribosomal protein L11